jgi:hypothetical protein
VALPVAAAATLPGPAAIAIESVAHELPAVKSATEVSPAPAVATNADVVAPQSVRSGSVETSTIEAAPARAPVSAPAPQPVTSATTVEATPAPPRAVATPVEPTPALRPQPVAAAPLDESAAISAASAAEVVVEPEGEPETFAGNVEAVSGGSPDTSSVNTLPGGAPNQGDLLDGNADPDRRD